MTELVRLTMCDWGRGGGGTVETINQSQAISGVNLNPECDLVKRQESHVKLLLSQHTFESQSLRGRDRWISEFESSLVFIESSRPANGT